RNAGRENAGFPLWPAAGRMNVGKVDAPLLPSCGNQVATDETQEAFAVPRGAVAEQDVGLIHAVDRPIRRHGAVDDVGEGWQEVHDGEHRVGCGVRLDLSRPADERCGPYRPLGHFPNSPRNGPELPMSGVPLLPNSRAAWP